MLEWLSVLLLIGVGLILLTIEMIFVPGTTILGIVGLICIVIGVFLSFQYFGSGVGWSVLIISSAVGLTALIYSLRSGVWDKFALKKTIDGHFNEEFPIEIQVGDVGEAVSALRPIGKADFNNKLIEVRSDGNYVKTGERIQVIRVDDNKVYVEPYTKK
jgi:membrane-bound ClpP family serine protease